MNVKGSTVLLTGATGGIGHAIARRLHGAGAQLILTGRRTDVLEPLAAELSAESLAVDLIDPQAVLTLASKASSVDILVNNAALPASGHVLDFTIEEIDRALDANLRAPIVLAHEIGKEMVTRGKGHIVFISSLAGKSSVPGSGVYSATKFGLRGLAQGFREDLHETGVGVTTIFPGFIRDAGMFAEADTQLPRGIGTSSPEEVAEAVVRGIEQNRGEIDVAPMTMRTVTKFAMLAPGLSARIGRKQAHYVGEQIVPGQANKR